MKPNQIAAARLKYADLVRWHQESGSEAYYIDSMVAKAVVHDAPTDALYFSDGKGWTTMRDLAPDHPFRMRASDQATAWHVRGPGLNLNGLTEREQVAENKKRTAAANSCSCLTAVLNRDVTDSAALARARAELRALEAVAVAAEDHQNSKPGLEMQNWARLVNALDNLKSVRAGKAMAK